MIIIIIIAVVIVIALFILIIALGRSSSKNPSVSESRKAQLSQEQAESLSSARSLLTSTRMTLSRIQDSQISSNGNTACDSIDKVLLTLKEKPEKIQTTRQLFNYYLPTMNKVAAKYQRIEASGTMEPEMPGKVKDYFNNIKEAMDNLYEGLFDNDKLNMTVDIEAMTIAVKRDGLLDEEDFRNLSASEDIPDIKA